MYARGVLRLTGMILLAVAVSLAALVLVYAVQNSPALINLPAQVLSM